MTALFTFPGGFIARLVEAMGEDGFGMLSGPAVRQHLFQPIVLGLHAEEEFADISPRLHSVSFGAGQDRIQHGRPRTCRLTS